MNTPKDDLEDIKFNSKRLEKRFLNTIEIFTDNPLDLCQYSRHKNVENFLFFCAKVK